MGMKRPPTLAGSKMTLEEQRIAIAEACGWKHWFDGVANRWKNEKAPYGFQIHPGVKEEELPNYPEDLNAMHEAENTLNEEQQIKFCIELRKCAFGTRNQVQMFYAYHATAAQRCEAFLRTIGKWKE